MPKDTRRLRSVLSDPVFLAAIVAMIGGVTGALITMIGNSGFEQANARCERAFAFLQDEAANPRMNSDVEFFTMQRNIALHCSRRAE